MARFLQDSSFWVPFNQEGDFYIQVIGYDDFKSVSPIKYFRVQAHYTLHYIISGSGTLKYGGKTHSLSAGDFFFLPPDEEILYYPDENTPWEYVWFEFNGKKSEEYKKSMGFTREAPSIKSQNPVRILTLLSTLMQSLKENRGNEYFHVLSVFYEIVYSLSEFYEPAGAAKAKSIIDKSFADTNLTVDELCRTLNISHSHLSKSFKQKYNISIIKYIINRRLEFAQKLLLDTNLSVKSISLSCGYTDEIHFMKSFKRKFLCTPKEYRKNLTHSQ